MSDQENHDDRGDRADHIGAHISGPVHGQVAVGKDIRQSQAIGTPGAPVGEEELAELRRAFAELKARVEAEAPPDKREAARERIGELEEAVLAKKPDLSTMEYVKKWFSRSLPKLAGAVTSVVVHPIVGRLVEAAGEGLSQELRRRLGTTDE